MLSAFSMYGAHGKVTAGSSLVVQWPRLRAPNTGAWAPSLVGNWSQEKQKNRICAHLNRNWRPCFGGMSGPLRTKAVSVSHTWNPFPAHKCLLESCSRSYQLWYKLHRIVLSRWILNHWTTREVPVMGF